MSSDESGTDESPQKYGWNGSSNTAYQFLSDFKEEAENDPDLKLFLTERKIIGKNGREVYEDRAALERDAAAGPVFVAFKASRSVLHPMPPSALVEQAIAERTADADVERGLTPSGLRTKAAAQHAHHGTRGQASSGQPTTHSKARLRVQREAASRI